MAVSDILHALIISCYDEKDYVGSDALTSSP